MVRNLVKITASRDLLRSWTLQSILVWQNVQWSLRSVVLNDPSVQVDGLLAITPFADTCLFRNHEFACVSISDQGIASTREIQANQTHLDISLRLIRPETHRGMHLSLDLAQSIILMKGGEVHNEWADILLIQYHSPVIYLYTVFFSGIISSTGILLSPSTSV